MSRDDACVSAGVVDDPEVSCYDCPTGMASMTDCPLSLKDFEAEQGCHDDNDDAQVMDPPLGCTFQCPFGTIPYETVCLEDLDYRDCDLENQVTFPAGSEPPVIKCPASIEERVPAALHAR